MKGILITIEGTEGCGKSTQVSFLGEILKEEGYPVEMYRDPGGTTTGEKIREILLNFPLDPLSELFLYLAARRQLVKEKIIPSLRKGKIVIIDRFTDSTIAYQGYGRGLPLEWIEKLNHRVTQGIKPHLTLLLLSSTPLGFKKKGENRIEKEKEDFHKRVREGYLSLAKREPHRVKVIEVKKGIEDTQREIYQVVKEFLRKR